MELSELVKSLQSFKGVSRKNSIENVTKTLGDVYNITGDVLLDFGDDASAIDIGDNQVVLLAADGIWGDLMNVDPYWAGYCAVLVNVNDIAAMGGKPIAMVNIMAVDNDEIYDEILSGIVAKVGDKVLVAIDTDGRQYPGIPLNWDTTYEKDAKLVQDQIKVMQKIAEEHLPSAGKDISNPGTLGTLEMLLESSGVGASVELEKIPRNENVDWDMWLRAYPGAAFVMTAPEENAQAIIDALSPYSFEVAVIGDVIEEKKLYLSSGDEKLVLFDQNSNPVLVMNQQ